MTATPFPGLLARVEPHMVDMFGHMSHVAYLQLMESARFDWAAHIGTPIPTMIERDRMGPALVKVELRYRRECRLGDRLRVTVTPLSARRRLGRLHQSIVLVDRDEVACEGELVFAMIDLDTRRARALPDGFSVPELSEP
ncbi:MAG: acyl-CoA thioesterase [Alphaproteobacteria bacterium]|nr:acyl-CoA thioesterase [Alphaproteobacteria bacterium]